MSHLPIDPSRDATPIRLFKSDFLEFFTHISPVTVVAVWLPVAIYFGALPIWRNIVHPGDLVPVAWTAVVPAYLLPCLLAGLFLWTFAEYTLHRFLFHHKPTNAWQERVMFLFHGIHHAQPQVKTRLVMPLPVSLTAALIFYGLFTLVAGRLLAAPQWVPPLMSGFLFGYLAYDLTHYATHHLPMRAGYAKYIKRHHMQHHYVDPGTRFGVSSPVWDWIFRTQGV